MKSYPGNGAVTLLYMAVFKLLCCLHENIQPCNRVDWRWTSDAFSRLVSLVLLCFSTSPCHLILVYTFETIVKSSGSDYITPNTTCYLFPFVESFLIQKMSITMVMIMENLLVYLFTVMIFLALYLYKYTYLLTHQQFSVLATDQPPAIIAHNIRHYFKLVWCWLCYFLL